MKSMVHQLFNYIDSTTYSSHYCQDIYWVALYLYCSFSALKKKYKFIEASIHSVMIA